MEEEKTILANCLDSTTVRQAFTNAIPKKLQQSRKRKLQESDQTRPTDADDEQKGSEAEAEGLQSSTAINNEELNGYHFYLHRPDLPGRQRSLTHIEPETTIGDALRGRLVIEFPTIYVLHETPDQLPEPFSLVHDDRSTIKTIDPPTIEAAEIDRTRILGLPATQAGINELHTMDLQHEQSTS